MTAEPNLAPPSEPGTRRRPERGSANPYASYVDLDAAPATIAPPPPPPPGYGAPQAPGFGPPPPAPPPVASFVPSLGRPKRSRTLRTVLLTLALILATVAGVGSYGANAYARSKVCDVFDGLSAARPHVPDTPAETAPDTVTATAPATQPGPRDVQQVRDELQYLRGVAFMLVYDGDLQTATRQTADGLERIVDVIERLNTGQVTDLNAAVTEIKDEVDRLQPPFRRGQRACHLPDTGLGI